MKTLPIWSTTNEHTICNTPIYCSKRKYKFHKNMNENENVMTIQWNNKPYIG